MKIDAQSQTNLKECEGDEMNMMLSDDADCNINQGSVSPDGR